jgi:hypothetical protein
MGAVMKSIAALCMLVAVSAWAVAQTATTSPWGNSAQAQAPQTMVVPSVVAGPGDVSTNTGTAVIIAPPSAPLLVTPEVHLTTVPPAAGARNATPGNTAGAVNATSEMPVAPPIITTVPQFATSGASLTPLVPSEGTTGISSAPAGSAAGAAARGNNTLMFDLGIGAGDDRSLAEVANQYRRREARAGQHVYTNDDINLINSKP